MYEFLNPFLAFLMTLPVILYLVVNYRDGKLVMILLLGYLLRCVLMACDLNQVFNVPHSGADTEHMHRIAAWNTYFDLSEQRVFTNYTIILTYIYSISGISRALAQYLNVIMGMVVLFYSVECMRLLKIKPKTMYNVLLLETLMPQLIIFSGILLREAWIQMFLAMSTYYFIRWFLGNKGGAKNIIYCLGCVLAATWMHNGCIAIFIGYAMAFLFYNPSTKTNSFSYRSVLSAILLVGFVAFYAANADALSSKFSKYEGMEGSDVFLARANSRIVAGSQYLMWLPQTNNVFVALLFSPLKVFYFLFSPIPFDWRGISDAVSFMLDSLIYLYLFWKLLTIRITIAWAKQMRRYLMVAFITIVFMFAYGTNVAGTAIRHRCKSVPVLFIAFALAKNYESRELDESVLSRGLYGPRRKRKRKGKRFNI